MKIDFDKILNELEPVNDKVFILPLARKYLLELSKKVGVEFPEIYLEFREKVGFTQDLLPDLVQTEDSLLEDLGYTEMCCKEFFPIGVFSTDEMDFYTWLIKKNSENGEIYQVQEEEENAEPKRINATIQSLIEKEIKDIRKGKSDRLNNVDKVRVFEFRFETDDFEEIVKILNKISTAKWIDERWRDKYAPNDLGMEVAFLKFQEYEIMVQREKDIMDDTMAYFFEIEEPLEKIKKESIAEKMKKLFEIEKVKYKFIDYGIMENALE